MKVGDLYDQYQIMPQLATHMLGVAGVGKIITNSWEDRAVANKCVKACLLHDLGNIVKFDLSSPVMPIENIMYWQEVQRVVRQKYGADAHEATYAMLAELKLDEYIGYLKEEAIMYVRDPKPDDFVGASRPSLIVLYSDLRVVPKGIVSMKARIADLIKRYVDDRAESRWGKDLEIYIQTLTKVDVTTISDRDVAPLFSDLLAIEI